MLPRTLLLSSLAFACGAALAQEAFPSSMKGQWKAAATGVVGETLIELVKMQDANNAEVKVTIKEVYNKPLTEGAGRCVVSEKAVAVREGDQWQIQVKNFRCASFTLHLKRVEGKQRFEGDFSNDARTSGTVFYEWD
jgi:hypothetical protein